MGVVAELIVPADSFPLGVVFASLPDVEVELDRVVPLGDGVVPYFWVRGASVEELLGRTATEFAPPGDDFPAAWQRFLDSDRERGEFPLLRPDGSEVLLEYAAVPNVVPGLSLSILRAPDPDYTPPAIGEAGSD